MASRLCARRLIGSVRLPRVDLSNVHEDLSPAHGARLALNRVERYPSRRAAALQWSPARGVAHVESFRSKRSAGVESDNQRAAEQVIAAERGGRYFHPRDSDAWCGSPRPLNSGVMSPLRVGSKKSPAAPLLNDVEVVWMMREVS